jgi:hypothetical protein
VLYGLAGGLAVSERCVVLQGMMSTLELLPMLGGGEPDVELFFSGVVADDDGEWAGGQALESTDASMQPSQHRLFTLQFTWLFYQMHVCCQWHYGPKFISEFL